MGVAADYAFGPSIISLQRGSDLRRTVLTQDLH